MINLKTKLFLMLTAAFSVSTVMIAHGHPGPEALLFIVPMAIGFFFLFFSPFFLFIKIQLKRKLKSEADGYIFPVMAYVVISYIASNLVARILQQSGPTAFITFLIAAIFQIIVWTALFNKHKTLKYSFYLASFLQALICSSLWSVLPQVRLRYRPLVALVVFFFFGLYQILSSLNAYIRWLRKK